ncbi:hypothetical protein K8R42_04005 [bacterium]|nr:hypothetical protein [bacterium]
MLKLGFEYRGKAYLLRPDSGMTAIELAEIMALFFNMNIGGSCMINGIHVVEKLSNNAARHFPGLSKALKP